MGSGFQERAGGGQAEAGLMVTLAAAARCAIRRDPAQKEMAVPYSTAKFREETSKKADSATGAALLRRTT
jgi:hypothetical protein